MRSSRVLVEVSRSLSLQAAETGTVRLRKEVFGDRQAHGGHVGSRDFQTGRGLAGEEPPKTFVTVMVIVY